MLFGKKKNLTAKTIQKLSNPDQTVCGARLHNSTYWPLGGIGHRSVRH